MQLFLDFLTFALPSGFISGAVTWLVGRRKRQNDLLSQMQLSIDLLCEKYNLVLQENVFLRQEKADWQVLQEELNIKIDKLTREVSTLRKNITKTTKTTKKSIKTPVHETENTTTPSSSTEAQSIKTIHPVVERRVAERLRRGKKEGGED